MLSTTTRALKRSLRTVSYRQTIPSPTLLTRSFAHSVLHFQDQRPPPPPPTPATEPPTKHAIGKIQRRLQITFTCTAPAPTPSHADEPVTMLASSSTDPTICGHRSTHEFSKTAYEKGIVLVECPSCKNRHLIGKDLSFLSPSFTRSRKLIVPLPPPFFFCFRNSRQSIVVLFDSFTCPSRWIANRYQGGRSQADDRGFDEGKGGEGQVVGRGRAGWDLGAGGIDHLERRRRGLRCLVVFAIRRRYLH